MLNRQVLLLCEHASNTLPIWANGYFPPDARKLLNSHRAWDKGVASLGKGLAQEIHCPLILGKHSRLLLDLNRSLDSKALWSEWSREMSEKLKQKAIREFYLSYRKEARECLRHHLSKGPTLVLALHSFTPTWKGKDRPTDLGILFRPETSRERQMADWMRLQLGLRLPNWKIHFNLPYRGHTDCFLNDLSEEFKDNPHMLGLFLEFNQKRLRLTSQRKKLSTVLSEVLSADCLL